MFKVCFSRTETGCFVLMLMIMMFMMLMVMKLIVMTVLILMMMMMMPANNERMLQNREGSFVLMMVEVDVNTGYDCYDGYDGYDWYDDDASQ